MARNAVGEVRITNDLEKALVDVDLLYTDCWPSAGTPEERHLDGRCLLAAPTRYQRRGGACGSHAVSSLRKSRCQGQPVARPECHPGGVGCRLARLDRACVSQPGVRNRPASQRFKGGTLPGAASLRVGQRHIFPLRVQLGRIKAKRRPNLPLVFAIASAREVSLGYLHAKRLAPSLARPHPSARLFRRWRERRQRRREWRQQCRWHRRRGSRWCSRW
jgi:hypothetical protein